MARGEFFKEKNNKKNKKSKDANGGNFSDAPVFVLPKIIEKKKKDA